MAAYLVSLITVTDPDKFKEYAALTAAAGAKYNGKFVTRIVYNLSIVFQLLEEEVMKYLFR